MKKWNVSLPFHFHVVNTDGTNEEQNDGGFWSAGFYIVDSTALQDSAMPTTISGKSTTALAMMMTTTTMTTLTAITSASTSADNNVTSTLHSGLSPTTQSAKSGLSSTTKLSLGLGLGLGGALLIAIAAGGIMWMRLRKLNRSARDGTSSSAAQTPSIHTATIVSEMDDVAKYQSELDGQHYSPHANEVSHKPVYQELDGDERFQAPNDR